MTNKIKHKYDLTRDTKDFFIASINDHTIWFAAKVLDKKLVRKMRTNQCTTRTIVVVELCAASVQLNWSQYLLNELLEDVKKVQAKGSAFHYSWLLILISFVVWAEPTNYQGVDVLVLCRGIRYQNLWFDKELSQRQKDNNIEFFLQGEPCDIM